MDNLSFFKQYITEEKSISNDVKILGNYVAKAIFNDSVNTSQKLSNVKGVPYIENEFIISIDEILNGMHNNFGIDTLTVKYILYNCDSKDEYYEKVYSYGINSEASYEDKRLVIVSGMVKGYILPDFIDDIYHELTHLLQYGMGMEKRVNLYDNVINLLKKSDNEISNAILRIMYMSFKHEQDAFAHQFYSKLRRTKEKRSFDDVINETEYGFYKKLRTTYFYGKTFEGEVVDDVLSKIGMTREQFEKRMNYGASRLRSKMKNAYDKYLIDTIPNNIRVEENIKYDISKNKILKEYKKRYPNIEYGFESIYDF